MLTTCRTWFFSGTHVSCELSRFILGRFWLFFKPLSAAARASFRLNSSASAKITRRLASNSSGDRSWALTPGTSSTQPIHLLGQRRSWQHADTKPPMSTQLDGIQERQQEIVLVSEIRNGLTSAPEYAYLEPFRPTLPLYLKRLKQAMDEASQRLWAERVVPAVTRTFPEVELVQTGSSADTGLRGTYQPMWASNFPRPLNCSTRLALLIRTWSLYPMLSLFTIGRLRSTKSLLDQSIPT